MASHALSISNDSSPFIASSSCSLYLRRLTGEMIKRPASNSKLTAYFSDHGRLFQADHGRRFSAIVDEQRMRANEKLNVSQSTD